MKIYSEEEVLDVLREQIKGHGSQRKVAILHGISAMYLNDIINGRRALSDKMLAKMGFERVIVVKE